MINAVAPIKIESFYFDVTCTPSSRTDEWIIWNNKTDENVTISMADLYTTREILYFLRELELFRDRAKKETIQNAARDVLAMLGINDYSYRALWLEAMHASRIA